MSKRSVVHGSFVIERTYDAPPARVFAAFSRPELKTRWFGGPKDWDRKAYTMDFRVGGREHSAGAPPGQPLHVYNAVYQDIVPDRRIVLTYDLLIGETRISVSLMTVELIPEGHGTRVVLSEQDAFLDGYDDAGSREHGTRQLLDNLGRELARQMSDA